MSLPSRIRSVGIAAPVIPAIVGNRSIAVTISSRTIPAAIRPGHRMTAGTRWPPSNVVPLPSRSGPAEPLCDPLTSHGPLSDVKTTNVCSSRPSRSRVPRISPTDQSISAMTSP